MIIRNITKAIFIYVLLYLLQETVCLEVLYAINAGGKSHIDENGVKYENDPLDIGTASDYGVRLTISRVGINDQILYQTERYHTETFGYDINLPGDGDYVMVLKFCEVYFNEPNKKVFDVVINGEHIVIPDLDIYKKVGRGVALDEYVEFSISNNKVIINDEESDIKDNIVRVEFVKSSKDNPKINAIYVIRGPIDEIPKLPPIKYEQDQVDEEEDEEEVDDDEELDVKRQSGPRIPDPYQSEDSSILLPIFISVGAFIPLLYCLCRL